MTDDLVKRLEQYSKPGRGDDHPVAVACREAKARIEALTAKCEALGQEVNMAKYGQPDFAWSIHLEAMADLEADNARLQGMVDKCQSIAKDAVSMCNEGIPVSAKNVAMAVLRALTGNVTVGGGRVDWGDQPVAALTGKADT